MGRRGSKGTESIRKRGNRWQARYPAPDGKDLSATFARKFEAEDWLTDVKADIKRGEYVPLRLAFSSRL